MQKFKISDTESKASPIMPPAREPEIAVEEEFETARQHGTVDALELFVQRHPESSQAVRARGLVEKMRNNGAVAR